MMFTQSRYKSIDEFRMFFLYVLNSNVEEMRIKVTSAVFLKDFKYITLIHQRHAFDMKSSACGVAQPYQAGQ